MNPWIILNIEKTDDKELVKKAYMQMLAKHNPEEDAEGFQRVRSAYENALAEIDGDGQAASASPPVAEFIEKMKALYDDFQRRIKMEDWEELLSDDVCLRLELEDELLFNVLDFLAVHNHLPTPVWTLIIAKFDIEAQAARLKREFHPGFIDFVVSNIKEDRGFAFELFDTTQNKDFDRAIYLRNEICFRTDNRDLDGIGELFDELDALDIYHPDFFLEKARYLALVEEPSKALQMVEDLFSKHPGHLQKSSYAAYVKGAVLLEFDDEGHLNQAVDVYKELLAKYPHYYHAQINLLDALVKLKRLEDALDFATDEILARHPSNPYVLSQAFHINDMLVTKREEEYAQNSSDSETVVALADCYCNAHRSEDAYTLLIKNSDIRSAKYFALLAFCCLQRNAFEESTGFAGQANELEPKYGTYLTLIRALGALKQPEKALEKADYALSQDLPVSGYNLVNKALILLAKADIYKDLKQYGDAMAAIDSAIEINDQMAQLYAAKAEICKDLGDFADAIEQAEISASIFPMYDHPYEIMAEVFYITENFDQVDELITRMEQYSTRGYGLKYFKACSLHQEQKSDEAITMLTELLCAEHLGKWEEKAYLTLYDIYTYQDESEKAYECLCRGVDKLPDNESLLEELGFYYGTQGDEKALGIWESLIRLNPDSETAFNHLAMHLQDTGKPEEALDVLNKKISQSPQALNLRIRRGFILRDIKRHKDALEDFLYAVEQGRDAYLWWNLDVLYYEIAFTYNRNLNDAQNALKYFELSLDERDGSGNDALLSNCYIGNLYTYYFKDSGKAIEYYNKAIELDDSDYVSHFHRGVAYQHAGRSDLAKEGFLKTIELCREEKITYHGYHTYIAQAYIFLGELRKAHSALAKSAKMVKTDGTDNGECFCVYYGWALYYQSKCEKQEALENIEIALSMLNSVMNNCLKQEILALSP